MSLNRARAVLETGANMLGVQDQGGELALDPLLVSALYSPRSVLRG